MLESMACLPDRKKESIKRHLVLIERATFYRFHGYVHTLTHAGFFHDRALAA